MTQRSVNVGDVVQVDETLTNLTVGRPWVTANFKETQLTDMRAGQPVEIAVDTYPGRPLHGHVDSLQAGTGARFSLLPPENATGNFVKVVQRVPVKIVFDEPAELDRFLALGMSVVPTVRVDGRQAAPWTARPAPCHGARRPARSRGRVSGWWRRSSRWPRSWRSSTSRSRTSRCSTLPATWLQVRTS